MAFTEPSQNLEVFGLQEGMIVADLGTGSGFYSIEAAKKIKGGKVYAIDIQDGLLSRLRGLLSKEHLASVELIHGDIEVLNGTKLASGIADAAFICNTLFQIEKKDDFLEETKRILKPTGRVLLIEWSDSFNGLGPHADHVVTAAKASELFKAHGFQEVKRFEAGDHHYGFIYRKQ
jgi:ubiquinone/menaquinone biosynthesis C-methylase UbiE